jgi:Lrp/AsnC family transcriptional regulator, leucine-responsive regulatory protein
MIGTLAGPWSEPIENLAAEAQECCAYMPGTPLDEIDDELLGLLQEDASRTLLDLGQAVRLSPSAVQRRIRRYLSSGLIARRAAVLDPRALGEVLLALVLVELKSGAAEQHTALRRRLLDAPEVQQCYDVAGRWDYVVVLTARDMPHCRELVARLFLDDPGISRCETLPVFDAVKLGLAVPTRFSDR